MLFLMLLKNKNKKTMEENNPECDAPQKSYAMFGEEFAYMAITATVAWTFAIINVVTYIA